MNLSLVSSGLAGVRLEEKSACDKSIFTRKIAVIVNAGAGSAQGESTQDSVAAAFKRFGVSARVVAARGSELRLTARKLQQEGYNIIAAGGGDGTISSVASELAGGPAALGVLPLGTLNHFAHDLGLPPDLDKAVEIICAQSARAIDVVTVNGQVFINNSSLGIYPYQVRLRESWQAKIGKWPAAVIASMVVFLRLPYLRLTVEIGGKRITRRCAMVMISNNEYKLEPGNLTQRERLDRGAMGVYLLRSEGRFGLIRAAVHSLVFKLKDYTNFEHHSATEAIIYLRRRHIKVAMDGEIIRLESPLHYRVMPAGLRVIAPEQE